MRTQPPARPLPILRRRGATWWRLTVVTVATALMVLAVPRVEAGAASPGRVVRGTVASFEYDVLLPPGYDGTQRRYPVVYVITGNGGDVDSASADLGLSDYAARDEAIIVTPVETQHNNFMPDWADGSRPLDHDFVSQLMPRIDAQFRTIPGRAHRAIGGLSAGGYSAMAIAARHPDLFVSAAAFSGVVDIKDRGPVAQGLVEIEQSLFTDMQPDELFRRFGNPYTSPLSWAERNPADLARNLRGMQLFVGSGDGVPADTQDVATGGAFLWQRMLVEEQVSSMARHFVEILDAAAVPVTYRSHPGTHEARHWRDDLAAWWPLMMDAVDSPPPSAFDYRRADERFSVWRWTFAADPVRAAEFLDISGASRTGVTLTGSGIETVTTAPAFRPGERVALTGAQARSTVAGRDGRLRFTVDLGPAHQAEQGTPQAAGQTFLTRTVRFRSQAIAGGPRA